MQKWSVIVPSEPDDVALVSDKRDEFYYKTQGGSWVSAYSGETLTWEKLVSERGPITEEEEIR